MYNISPHQLARYLDAFSFDLEVVEDEGEYTAALPKLGVLGFGASLDEAIDDLLVEVRAYAIDYFERATFYAATDRSEHAPWLLRFALTPAAEQRALVASLSAGRFRAILRYQLRVTEAQFWLALETRSPVDRSMS